MFVELNYWYVLCFPCAKMSVCWDSGRLPMGLSLVNDVTFCFSENCCLVLLMSLCSMCIFSQDAFVVFILWFVIFCITVMQAIMQECLSSVESSTTVVHACLKWQPNTNVDFTVFCFTYGNLVAGLKKKDSGHRFTNVMTCHSESLTSAAVWFLTGQVGKHSRKQETQNHKGQREK